MELLVFAVMLMRVALRHFFTTNFNLQPTGHKIKFILFIAVTGKRAWPSNYQALLVEVNTC